MISSVVVLATSLFVLVLLFFPQVAKSRTWRATVTPLASIIGSGFLVLGPILKHSFEAWSSIMMLFLCVVAYSFGSAIRFNITKYDRLSQSQSSPTLAIQRLEVVSSVALVLAYIVSITYYLNLFGAFAVSLTSVNDPRHARLITSGVLSFMCLLGWRRGFSALEPIEEGTVGLKLAIIAGLLAGLGIFAVSKASAGMVDLTTPASFNAQSICVALGLIITVQGFETSRYLGGEFDARTRVKTMRYAQWLSALIYMAYIVLVTLFFTSDEIPDSETGIIGMTQLVAPVLPVMLVAAALAAQFSAAVADTGGCGGLAEEVSNGRITAPKMYLILGVLGLLLTWTADIYSIISYASRAFAIYYAFQCMIAFRFVDRDESHFVLRRLFFGLLAMVATLVVIFGRPAE